LSFGPFNPFIRRSCESPVSRQRDNLDFGEDGLHELNGGIGRGIINQEDLKVLVGLSADSFKAVLQISFPVPIGNDD